MYNNLRKAFAISIVERYFQFEKGISEPRICLLFFQPSPSFLRIPNSCRGQPRNSKKRCGCSEKLQTGVVFLPRHAPKDRLQIWKAEDTFRRTFSKLSKVKPTYCGRGSGINWETSYLISAIWKLPSGF